MAHGVPGPCRVIGSVAAVEEFMIPQTYNAIKAAVIVHAEQLALALAWESERAMAWAEKATSQMIEQRRGQVMTQNRGEKD